MFFDTSGFMESLEAQREINVSSRLSNKRVGSSTEEWIRLVSLALHTELRMFP